MKVDIESSAMHLHQAPRHYNYPGPGLVAGAVLALAMAAGCSAFAKKPQADAAQVSQFAGRGYDSGIDYQTSITRSAVNAGGGYFHFNVIQPVPEGKYPLVIYLPGLGESEDAAADLRNTWARSGYVVLSLQPLKKDAEVWSSDAARSHDYTFLRHQMYASATVSERLESLSMLVDYLKQQAATNGPAVQRMDLSRIAIAGFDIGAYTAMIAAGEAPQNVAHARLAVPVGAVIALSPYADFTGSDFEVRYRKIGMPVLSVTSDADSDMHGSVPPSLHQAPFQYMPPGNKYLLLLTGASHAAIGNEDFSGPVSAASDSPSPESGSGDGDADSGDSSHHRKKTSGTEADGQAAYVRGAGLSPTRHAMMEVALEQTSTAFLNAYIKGDAFSLDWLKSDAQPWLDKIGRLEQK